MGVASLPEHGDTHASGPRFTIVSPVYNVGRYLNEFIESVESQDYPLDRVEVIAVDDGSTDASAQILADWRARRPGLVTVVTQPNSGIGAARNAGMERARGEWITFADPDDRLTPSYLTEVDAFLSAEPSVEMVATKRINLLEATGQLAAHPLQQHFAGPNRVRNLDEHAEYFHGAANSAFFRTATLAREALRFDERIRPTFEDGHFCVSYLLPGRPSRTGTSA